MKLEEKMATSISKEDVIEFVANMSVLELSELIKEMEEKFGVSAAAPVAMMAAGPAEGAAGAPAGGSAIRPSRLPQPLRRRSRGVHAAYSRGFRGNEHAVAGRNLAGRAIIQTRRPWKIMAWEKNVQSFSGRIGMRSNSILTGSWFRVSPRR